MYLCTLPALPALLLLYKTGLEYWYIAAVVWAACALAQILVFRNLEFEVDLAQERTLQQDYLHRR